MRLLTFAVLITLWPALTANTAEREAGNSPGPRYAKNFTYSHTPNGTILSIDHTAQFDNRSFSIQVTSNEEKNAVANLPKTSLSKPLTRIATTETTQIGFLKKLRLLESVVATGSAKYVIDDSIRQRLADGDVLSIGAADRLQLELLVGLNLDAIFLPIETIQADRHRHLFDRLGVLQIPMADHLENHPLGRAEWIKVYGILCDRYEEAAAIFNEIETSYLSLKNQASSLESKPEVFCSAPYSGTWYVPGGRSYTAQLIQDAGGLYLWANNDRSGSLALDFERVYLKAKSADVWIKPSFYRSLGEMSAANPRFKFFDAYKSGAVYNQTAQVTESGSNRIWEDGILEPHRILEDLIHIFQSDRQTDVDFHYYEKLD